MNREFSKAFALAVSVVLVSISAADVFACSPPPPEFTASTELPEQIPNRGALPVVFYGSGYTYGPPLQQTSIITLEVRNSNDKLIPGDVRNYILGTQSSEYGNWSASDYLVAWQPTSGWSAGETYTLSLTIENEWDPEASQDIQHDFTVVVASGDVAAPAVDSSALSVYETSETRDCCTPDEESYNTCTGGPVEYCWTTAFKYLAHMDLDVAPVADDIWASQTLYSLDDHTEQRYTIPSKDSPTPFLRAHEVDDTSYCATPVAIRIADGSQVPGSEHCRDPQELPDYEERDANVVVEVPSECEDEVGAGDAGPDAGEDAGDSDAGDTSDDAGDTSDDAGASGSDAGTDTADGSNSGDSDNNARGGTASGCGCSNDTDHMPASPLAIILVGLGLVLRGHRRSSPR